jgi:hypothetical protein
MDTINIVEKLSIVHWVLLFLCLGSLVYLFILFSREFSNEKPIQGKRDILARAGKCTFYMGLIVGLVFISILIIVSAITDVFIALLILSPMICLIPPIILMVFIGVIYGLIFKNALEYSIGDIVNLLRSKE